MALAAGQARGHVEQGVVDLRGRSVAKHGEVVRAVHLLRVNDGVLNLPMLKQIEVNKRHYSYRRGSYHQPGSARDQHSGHGGRLGQGEHGVALHQSTLP